MSKTNSLKFIYFLILLNITIYCFTYSAGNIDKKGWSVINDSLYIDRDTLKIIPTTPDFDL